MGMLGRTTTTHQAAEEAARTFIKDPAALLPATLPQGERFKDFLAAYSRDLSSAERLRAMVFYTAAGCTRQDIVLLVTGSPPRQANALRRCRSLGLPLPDAVWESLTQAPRSSLRWAAASYLVAVKGRQASLWLARFLSAERNEKKDLALPLAHELAAHSPQALLSLVQPGAAAFLLEVCLEVLCSKPVPGSEYELIEFAKQSAQQSYYGLTLRALGVLPSAAVTAHLCGLARDDRVEVREQVAKLLGARGGREVVDVLTRLASDSHDKVRYLAVESLMGLGTAATKALHDLNAPKKKAIKVPRRATGKDAKV